MTTICKNPLTIFLFVAITLAIANGFSTVDLRRQSLAITTMGVASEVSNDFGSAMPEAVDPHVTIGVEPDNLAIGVDAAQFLEWIGT